MRFFSMDYNALLVVFVIQVKIKITGDTDYKYKAT